MAWQLMERVGFPNVRRETLSMYFMALLGVVIQPESGENHKMSDEIQDEVL